MHRSDLLNYEIMSANSAQYRAGSTKKQSAAAEIHRMIAKNFIIPMKAKYAKPTLFASKKDGTVCICVVYRKLKTITIRVAYSLHCMDERIDSWGEVPVFCTLQAYYGYS